MAAVPRSYSLKWHAHSGHLNSSIAMLYNCNAYADVMLATSDSHYFSAHQFVLSAFSPYFQSMFIVGGNRSKTNAKLFIILPPEIGHSTLNIILQYMYKGEAIVNHEQLPGIMKAAEILHIKGLCKDKHDLRTDGSNIFKQHISPGSESKGSSEAGIPNHRVIIPEVRYNSNPASINSYCTSPSSTSTTSRQTSPVITSPIKKKHRKEIDNSLKEYKKKDNESIDNDLFEKMIVGEEVQVKDEPVDWEDQKSSENITVVKEELESEEEELDITGENSYVPLSCDICQEKFTSPALWVRHVEAEHTTTSVAGGKRAQTEDASKEYPPLNCEMCEEVFYVPAEWVKHIQSHTVSQASQPSPEERADSPGQRSGKRGIECNVCGKILQSYTSMQIHARTHTGERPFLCKVCGREFNVKSNFVRHMRTLHNQIENHPTSQ